MRIQTKDRGVAQFGDATEFNTGLVLHKENFVSDVSVHCSAIYLFRRSTE